MTSNSALDCERPVTTTVRKCGARDIFNDPDGPALIAEYLAECAIGVAGKPEPPLDVYENLETAGLGQCFAAYEGSGLRGFAFVGAALARPDTLSCLVFAARNAHCIWDLMSAVERYAAQSAYAEIFYLAPVGSRLARLLFISEDLYAHTNFVFCRRRA